MTQRLNTIVIGNPMHVAIESMISVAYRSLGQRALGCFLVHVDGQEYGVRASDATLLACSVDEVIRRIARRGQHSIWFESEPDATKIADAVRRVMYDEQAQTELFFGETAELFRESLFAREILWVPDGDAAFDDGGHILQFDLGNEVRLISFKNEPKLNVRDVMLSAIEFYGILQNWVEWFENEWKNALN